MKKYFEYINNDRILFYQCIMYSLHFINMVVLLFPLIDLFSISLRKMSLKIYQLFSSMYFRNKIETISYNYNYIKYNYKK